MMRYHRTQAGWTLIVILGGVAAFMLARVGSALLVPALLVVLAAALFATLTVSVDDHDLRIRFGIGMIRRRFPLATIRSWASVQNQWWWGWGIRYYGGGTLYNVSGLSAVELTLDTGRRVRIGTAEPAQLIAALEQAAGARPPLTPVDQEAIRRQNARAMRAQVAIGVAVAIIIALVFSMHLQAPRVVVSGDSLSIRSALYSAHVPFADVTSASLEDELPRIELRTNGFAAGSTLRGNFRLAGMGAGKLFVNRRTPPFLVVKTRREIVIVNFDDPNETRQIYETLASRAALAAR